MQLLILANLSEKNTPISRYEIMASLNEAISWITHPYSPGAVYHCTKGLTEKKMIKFSQNLVQILPEGRKALEIHLTQAPPSDSILSTLVEIIALHCIEDPKIRQQGEQRLKINMIKINQFGDTDKPESHTLGRASRALKSCRQEMYKALARISIDLIA